MVVAPLTAIPFTLAIVSVCPAGSWSLASRLPFATVVPPAVTAAVSGTATGVSPVTLTVSVEPSGVVVVKVVVTAVPVVAT